MRQQREEYFLDLLHREVVLAMGCTEPAAVALACAYAAEALGRLPEKVEIRASSYILKNGMNVGIRNRNDRTSHRGGAGVCQRGSFPSADGA